MRKRVRELNSSGFASPVVAHLVDIEMSASPPLMEAKRTWASHLRNGAFDPKRPKSLLNDGRGAKLSTYSAILIPASLTTFAQCATWEFMRSPKSEGVPPTTSAPSLPIASRTFGLASALLMAALS
jgi:hypothetical protein